MSGRNGRPIDRTTLAALTMLLLGLAGPRAEAQPAVTPPPAAQTVPLPATPPSVPAPVPDATAPAAPTGADSVLPTDEAIQAAGFGDEVTLEARPALVLSGKTTWDDLYGTFRKAIADLSLLAQAQGAVASGPAMIRFVSSSDDSVDYEAILPVRAIDKPAESYAPAKPGQTPAGKALRFVHHGGYDTIEQTYDEITNHLDERSITAEDAFVEEYVRDPATTPETGLATFIYVFPKAN